MSVNWDVIVIFPIYGQFDNLEASILRMISVSLFINKLISCLHQRKEMSDFTNVWCGIKIIKLDKRKGIFCRKKMNSVRLSIQTSVRVEKSF